MIRFKFRKNKIALFVGLFLLFSSPCLLAQNGGKNSKNDLVKKTNILNEQILEIDKMLKENRSDKMKGTVVLVNINMKLEKRQELIDLINVQIRELNKAIKANESQVAQLTASLEKLKREYARMIIFAQRNQDTYSVLMFIFAAENFTQAYSRLKYIQQYSEFRKKQAIEIIETQTQMLAKLNELREQRKEKNALLGIENEEKKSLSSEKVEQEQVLTELQKKEKQLKTELEKKKRESIQLQEEIRRQIELEIKRKAAEAAKVEAARLLALKKAREDSARKAQAVKVQKKVPTTPVNKTEKPPEKAIVPSTPDLTEQAEALSEDFSNNRGKLPWPISKGIICEGYGEHEHPAIKGFMMFNNGLEICSTKGSQARAVFAGEVTSIAISPTGGKLVIIRHGEYLSVYCNLEEILVKTGDKVSVKQVIGSVMFNDDEGKTSMNFQIWKGQKTMDPSGWLLNAR